MSFCPQPFNRIEIYENGDVFNCCPPFLNNYSIGNIFEAPFDEIWNGKRAKELRRKILSADYSLCADICNRKINDETNDNNYSEVVEKYPEEISISSDNICNIRCRICRDKQFHTEYDRENLEDEIKNIWMPILKNAKLLRFGCSGEPFASYKEIQLIKSAAKMYPDLKFHIHTNGILGTEARLKDINIYDRIDTITLSLHSASRWTYNKIIRGGNYDRVMSNIRLYSKMRAENLLKQFRLVFVVYSENYKDMTKFIELAKKNNAVAEFWALRLVETTQIGKNFDKYSITNPNHKKHKELLKLLNQPVFKDESVHLYPELKKLI